MRQVCAKSTAALLGFAVVSFGPLAHFLRSHIIFLAVIGFCPPVYWVLSWNALALERHFLGWCSSSHKKTGEILGHVLLARSKNRVRVSRPPAFYALI